MPTAAEIEATKKHLRERIEQTRLIADKRRKGEISQEEIDKRVKEIKESKGTKVPKKTKRPKRTKSVPEYAPVREDLRSLLDAKGRDPHTGLSPFQTELVQLIQEHETLGVLDICHMMWTEEELKNSPTDLTRVVRNAIRVPKKLGFIGHAEKRGCYRFLGWDAANR